MSKTRLSQNTASYLRPTSNVYTIVLTMRNYIATVIKSGNSYALRVPKEYVDSNNLKLGQKVKLANDPSIKKGNVAQAMQALQKLADTKGSMKSISDPVAWQAALRDEVDEWSTVIRDIGR